MDKFKALLRASHFGPTLLVTSISILFSLFFHSPIKSFFIGIVIFSGQLIVGWTNDLIDYEDDLKHQRNKKPLVSKVISRKFLLNAIAITLPVTISLNLAGPLGLKGGMISIFGILVALSYNFYFKFTMLSPLPYAIAFGALPCAIVIAAEESPKTWLWLAGALLGTAAHFINVIKDLDDDLSSGIKGLPQILGKKKSITISVALIVAVIIIFFTL